MDPEKQRWLQEALSSMTVDVVKELANCIVALQSPNVSVCLSLRFAKWWMMMNFQNYFESFFLSPRIRMLVKKIWTRFWRLWDAPQTLWTTLTWPTIFISWVALDHSRLASCKLFQLEYNFIWLECNLFFHLYSRSPHSEVRIEAAGVVADLAQVSEMIFYIS